MHNDNFLHRVCNSICADVLFSSDSALVADYLVLTEGAHMRSPSLSMREAALAAHFDRVIQYPAESVSDFHVATRTLQSSSSIIIKNPLDEDELTREILKLALTNELAFHALRRVFLEHKYPSKLDPLGQSIRSILINLDKGNHHGESQTKEESSPQI